MNMNVLLLRKPGKKSEIESKDLNHYHKVIIKNQHREK